MKYLIIFILFLNFTFLSTEGWGADYVLNVSFKTTLRIEGSERFVDAVVVLNPQHKNAKILSSLELRADVDLNFFDGSDGNSGFTFKTFDSKWIDDNYYQAHIGRVMYVAPRSYMEIYWATDDIGNLDPCLEDDPDCPFELPLKEDYEWGVFSWKLLPTANGKVRIRLREYDIDEGIISCIAFNDREQTLVLSFVGDNIERDATGAACIVIDVTDPFAGIDPPTDLAGVDKICGTPQTANYTVTRPATVDSCAWYISSDETGNNRVDNVASIVVTEKGEKAAITWNKTTEAKNYYVQVQSIATSGDSDPIHLAVRVEDFPDFAGISPNIACRSTELSWTASQNGITTQLYRPDYSGGALTSPYTCTKEGTYHFVRYREANQCQDTVDYPVPFLNPRIEWIMAPKATAQRGEELQVLVDLTSGIPTGYTPAKTEYIWVKPATQPVTYTGFKTQAVNKKYEYEVFAQVDGCSSDTLTGETNVEGGGIKPTLSTESGQEIACKDGGILLKAKPEGGSGNYAYKWYAGTVSGTPLATTADAWVSPTADTEYIVVITDEDTGEEVNGSIRITYKDVASPVVSAGADQQIVSGTYTYLLGTVVSDGASTNYDWNWKPADKLNGSSGTRNVQTAALTAQQKYAVFVVDANGCMSKPDSVNVGILPVLPPELEPDPKGEEFALSVVPENAALCKNNSVQFEIKSSGINLEDAVYSWSPATGLNAADVRNPVLTAVDGVTSGDYFVTVAKGDFSIVRKVSVTVNTAEEAPQLRLADKRMSCTGDVVEVAVTGNEPDRYVWMVDGVEFENNGKTYTLASAGEHTIKVYGKNNGASCASDTLSVSGTIGLGVVLTDVTPIAKVCGSEAELSFGTITPGDAPFKWIAADDTELSATAKSITVNEAGEYRLVSGSGACSDTTRIQVVLNNVLAVEGLKPVITGCGATAELAFDTTTAPAFVWLDAKGEEIAGSKNKKSYTVSAEGTYQLRLDGGDCQEMYAVKVALNTKPIVNDVLAELTTCGSELPVPGSASQGTLYWAEDKAGNTLVTSGVLTGSNETKTYYVYADAGDECKSEPMEVKVSFGAAPKVIADVLQTSCELSYALRAETTGTGSVKWYESQTSVTPVSEVVTGTAGTSREYWACAEDSETCVGERVKVLVKFGVGPVLEVNELQTTCGEELELAASTTGGRLIWKEAGSAAELLLTKVKGNSGEIKHYEVHAEDGSCISETKTVEVRFGSNPEVLANNLYTTCGTQFTLQGSVSGGTLNWYSDAAGENPLSSLTVNKGAYDVTTYYAQAVDGTCKSPLKDVRVAFNSDPYVEALSPQTSCASNAVIALKATTTGGSLVWENADGTKLASSTVNTAGTYYVYAEDGTCKSTKEAVEVKFGTSPTVNAEPLQTVCGKEYTLTATASGGSLKWYDSSKNEINTRVTGNTSSEGTYYVKAVDGSCESAETEVKVRFGILPTVTAEPEITTCENVVKLEASTTGGTLYWTEKSTGRVLPIPQVTSVAGTSVTYTVYARDATCTSAVKEVTIHFGNKPQLIVVTDQTACGTEHTLEASAADGAQVKWLRADKATTLSDLRVTGSKGTVSTYWVYAEKDGCSSDLTEVTVAFGELPKVEVMSPQTTCGTSITLSALVSGGSAVWKKADGSALTDLTVSGSEGVTDVYYVSAEDGACRGSSEKVEVKFGALPQVIVDKDITTCEEELELTAMTTDPQAAVHWLEADKTTPVTVAKGASGSSKKYYVYAKTSSCEGPMAEVTVHFGTAPTLQADPVTTCDTIAVLAAKSSVSDLVWTDANGKTLASTQVHGAAGTSRVYYVQARDGRCTSKQEAVRVDFGKAPELMLEEIQTICSGDEYNLQAQATGKAEIVWYQADGITPLTNTTVRKVGGGALVYYAKAQDGTCASEKKKVSVLFDQAPLLNIEKELQTTCGTSLTLQGSASAGEVVWMKPDGTVLSLPQVSGSAGEVQQYYAYAQDGTCESVKKTVEVHFGVSPEVDVNLVQTACGESHELTAVASDGVLHWLESDRKTELAATTVTGDKGTEKTYYVYAENGKDCKSDMKSVTVMFGTAPMLVGVLTPQTACGASVQLTAKATAGEVEWRDALGTLLATPLVSQETPGDYIYYAQAKEETCSGASQEVTVRFGARPEVVCEAVQTTCSTSSYEIAATATEGILHYLGSDRKTELASATVTAAGTYYVYAQAPGCVSDTVAVEVKLGAKPEVTVEATQSTCEDVLQLEASATGGELFWEKLTPDNNIEPLLLPQVAAADGIKMCYVYAATSRDDQACRSEKMMVNVDFGAKPEVYVEDMLTTCATDNYELKATASAGAAVHWLADDGVTSLASTTVSGAANATASYWVYADMGSCRSDKKEVTVAFGVAPIVSVLDTLTSCSTSLTLNATTSAGTLKWLEEDGTPLTNMTVNNVLKTPKVYYVYAQDGSCESVKHRVVALFGTNPLVLADLLQTTCDAESHELQAQATEGTLYWLDTDKTPLTSTTVKGRKGESHDYYVYAEKDASCKSKEYRITVEFGADPMLDAVTPQTICAVGGTEVIADLKATATGGKLVWTDEDGNVLATTQQKAVAPVTKYYYVHAEDKTCTSVTERVEVRFGGRPVVFAEELQTSCGESLTLSGTASSGSLVWSDGRKNLSSTTVTPAQGETYYVMAKDGECESVETTVNVLFNTNPVVDVVTPQTTCGTQIQLEAKTTGGDLVWLNANGDKMNLTQVSAPRGTKATYFVYAKGESCEGPKQMVEVEFGTLPKIMTEEIQTACGTSHVLTASATDGEVIWLDAAKKPLSSATVTGNEGESKDYYVYAKAVDCESEPQKVTVRFGESPVVFAKALQTTCEETLQLEASATGGELVWTAEDGTELPTAVVTGRAGENAYYFVTAEDGSCRSVRERVEMRFGAKPEVLLASDLFTTCGTEYTLEAEASSGQVNWYASKEASAKMTSTLVTKPASADYAEYYAQAQNGTCVGEKQKVTVVFGSKPLVTVTTPQTTCDDRIVLSAATTGGDLVWTDDKNQVLSSLLVEGTQGSSKTYYVQAQDGGASCQSETKEVFVSFGTAPSVNVVADQTTCGTKLNLQATATGGDVYWLKNDKSPLASTEVEGVRGTVGRYYVYAGDGSCKSDTVEVSVAFGADPQIDVVDVQTSCGDVVELQGKTSGGTLKWTTADGAPILPAVVNKPASGNQLTCYVEAVDGTCTSDRKQVTVKFGAAPEILAETLQTSCDKEHTLTASASAGNIIWEDEEHRVLTSTTVRGEGVKTYYVYAGAGKDCVSEKMKVKVAFGADPVVNVMPLQTACSATALELKATASAGTLVWESEDGTKLTQTTVTPEMGNIYRVYALDGKCRSVEETVEVKFNAKPVLTVEPLQVTCGTTLELRAGASGGEVMWVDSKSKPIDTRISSANGATQQVYAYVQDGTCTSDPVAVTVKFGERPELYDLQSTQTACMSPYQLQAKSTGGEIVWLQQNGKEIVGNWVDLPDDENVFFVHVEDESCSPAASADERVTVVLGGRPELTLTTTHCAGDSIFAEETNGMEGLVYRWFVNGRQETAVTGHAYAFADGGEFTVKVVAETAGGCISDTVSGTYRIVDPLRLAWDPEPVGSTGYGNNIRGCAKAASGDATDISWHWVSPTNPAITGSCANIAALEPEYDFEVYATNKSGCASDTLRATTTVTGFAELEVTLESATGTEICKDGSALLTATVNGGQAPYTYEWFVKGTTTPVQKVTTSSTVNVLAAAPQADVTYVLKVRDSQARPGIANKEIALTIKDGTIPVADAGPDMTIQRGLQTLLKAGGGDGIAAWEWLPVEKLAAPDEAGRQYPLTMNLSTSQKYQLYVANAEGCISQPDEMVVFVLPFDGTEIDIPTPPVPEGLNLAIQPAADTLCLGAERWIAVKDLLGNLGSGAAYTWVASPAAALTMNAKKDSALFTPAAAGNYTFSVFVEDGGKKMALRSDIVVGDGEAPQFDLVATGSCQNDTVKMVYKDGSAKANQWEWKVKGNVVANAADYYVLSTTGSYKVEATAGNSGCGSDRKAVDVTVGAAPEITALAVTDSCGRAVIEVTAAGATAGYTWMANPEGTVEGGTDTRYVITAEGKYKVTVEASNGTCSAVRSIEGEVYSRPQLLSWITEPMDASQVNINITADVAAQGGTPAYTYHWLQPDDAKTVTTGSYTQLATLASYTFEVYASDANGCLSDTLKKSVSVAGGQVEIEVESVYGKEICQGGAAMLVARAKGVELPCLFEWSKVGTPGVCRGATQNSEYDTLWIKASEAGDYKVQVKQNAVSAILASAQLEGLTVNSSKTAPEVVTEHTLTIPTGGKTVLVATASDGTPAYQWHWSPADKLDTPADTAVQYPQTAALDARQKYRVYVTDAASCVSEPAQTLVDVDDEFGLCVAINPKNTEICRGNTVFMNADVTCGKPVGYDLEYSWLPADLSALLDAADKESAVFTPTGEGEYTWVVEVKNGTLKAAARATVTVKNADAPVLTLDGRWDCVNDTLILTNSGEPAEKYVWSVDGIEVAEAGERLILADTGTSRVNVYAVAANGCLSDSISVETQLGVVPEVEIAGGAFVNYPDSVNILRVKQADGLTTDLYDFAWSSLPDNKINGATDQLSAITFPMTEDVKYTIVATSKTNPVCRTVDTVWGYMIPKTAPVEIDKDENTGDLYLSWSRDTLGLADSVRVMNIKWDGYAVESYYKPLAMAAGEVEKYIIDSSKDTLEFFYINASRYIPEMGRSYYSLSSDTVGYFKQWIYANSNTSQQINFISYPFDLNYKGIATISDLGKFMNYTVAGTKLSYFDSSTTKWNDAQYMSTGGGKWMPTTTANIKLEPGSIYRVQPKKGSGDKEVLFFGKLPSRFIYDIPMSPDYLWVPIPLSFGNSVQFGDFGKAIPLNVAGSAMEIWTFDTQRTSKIQYMSTGGGKWMPTNSASLWLKVFTPVRISSKQTLNNWSR